MREVLEIDARDSATKKESAALLPKITDKSATPTDSELSISQLVDYVNPCFPDILPEGVQEQLREYWEKNDENKNGKSQGVDFK